MPTTTVTDILDQDNMSSDSATALATQQSIKAYVDSQLTAEDLDFSADTGGALVSTLTARLSRLLAAQVLILAVQVTLLLLLLIAL